MTTAYYPYYPTTPYYPYYPYYPLRTVCMDHIWMTCRYWLLADYPP